jgi:hypothetical protein
MLFECAAEDGHLAVAVDSPELPLGFEQTSCCPAQFPSLDAMQLIERGFIHVSCTGVPNGGGRSYLRARHIAGIVSQLGQAV